MTTDHNERPGHEDLELLARRRRRLASKGLAFIVLAVLVVIFVVQNYELVRVHFWVVAGRTHLVWVLLACLVVGTTFGWVLRGRVGRARRLRREERDIRRHGGERDV
jgi:uncharacterized integral membrane protein